jgi:hypothetical protein
VLRFSRCELVAEAGNISGIQRNGNARRWKLLPSNGSEDLTMDTNVCVILNCKVQSRAVSKNPINPVISATPVCIHIIIFNSETTRSTPGKGSAPHIENHRWFYVVVLLLFDAAEDC